MLLKALFITTVKLGFAASRSALTATEQPSSELRPSQLPPPATDKIWSGHLKHGTALSEKFFDTSPSESAFELSDLKGPGSDWTMIDEAQPSPEDITAVLGSARQIRKSDPMASVGDWTDVTFSQSKKYSCGYGGVFEPTWAEYRSVLSHGNGVFVLMDFQSPEDIKPDAEPEDLPELQYLEDLVFLDWTRGEKDLEPPSWFLLKNITAHESAERKKEDLSIISSCLHSYKRQTPPPWPGITFPVGSSYLRAILGTYPSSEIADFLLHFPRAAMASVTVYAEGDGINLLWFGGKLDLKQLKIWEAANAAYESRSPGELEFPYGMVPGKDARIVPFRGKGKKRPASEMEE